MRCRSCTKDPEYGLGARPGIKEVDTWVKVTFKLPAAGGIAYHKSHQLVWRWDTDHRSPVEATIEAAAQARRDLAWAMSGEPLAILGLKDGTTQAAGGQVPPRQGR